jgi:uncharacterized membrane protein
MEPNTPQNPYAAPTVDVLSAPLTNDNVSFIPEGRATGFGQGLNWITRGWNIFTQAPLIWIVNAVIVLAIYVVLSLIPFIGSILSMVLYALLGAGLMIGAHSQHGGRPLEVADVFSGFQSPHKMNLFILGLLYMVSWTVLVILAGILFAIFVGASGVAGSLMSGDSSAIVGLMAGAGIGVILIFLFVMALSIPIAMAFWFAPTLVALNGVSPLAALSSSFSACLKNFLPFLLYGVIFFVLFFIGLIPLGLGLLVVFPLLFSSTYAAYRDIYLADDSNS